MPEASPKFQMTVDMSVLESLGINLYSNAAAVLSELVANAWDADANKVSITWGKESVVISDDGIGMTADALNDRFLKVGYQKRVEEGGFSPKWNRPFMGRKGIGKLSVFSIADRVCVYSTTEEGTINGLEIEVGDLRRAIKDNRPYHPREIDVPEPYREAGTHIILESLKSKRADLTVIALRKRLARRFDVLDRRSPEEGGFAIFINGNRITFADRQELKKLEFIWEFGRKTLDDSVLPTGIRRFVLEDNVVDESKGWTVSGWIGTARRPNDLTEDQDAGSLKNIIILARKRPIQEGFIERLDFSRLFGNYVTGQIEADFLDLDDGYDDIATSDRQRLIEDDPRVTALQQFLRTSFNQASQQWAEERPKKEVIDAVDRYPQLREWIDTRPGWQKPAAEKMIGTIAGLEFEGRRAGKDRADLFRSGILAFERVGLRQVIEDLENLSSLTAEDMLPILADQESYEAALWVDILRSRVEAISKFKEITSTDEKEKVLQSHLFHNLWMLDPSWERATNSEVMEQDLRAISPGGYSLDDAGKKRTGRMDIRYATTGGKHIIVELKRYSIRPDIADLVEQGTKYAVALRDILSNRGDIFGDPLDQIEVVFVLGGQPKMPQRGLSSETAYIRNQLASINGRIVLYDELIGNAKKQYSEYLEASEKAQRLDNIMKSFDVSD